MKKWEEVVDTDFPKIKEVTRKMISCAYNQHLKMVGCVRLAMGKLSTTKNLQERRERLEKF